MKKALSKGDISAKAHFVPSNGAMKTAVAQDPYAIGYVSVGHIDKSVAPVALDGVAPTLDNVKQGKYKVARGLYSNTKGDPRGVAKKFIDYLYSAEGQKIVAETGIAHMRSMIFGFISIDCGAHSKHQIFEMDTQSTDITTWQLAFSRLFRYYVNFLCLNFTHQSPIPIFTPKKILEFCSFDLLNNPIPQNHTSTAHTRTESGDRDPLGVLYWGFFLLYLVLPQSARRQHYLKLYSCVLTHWLVFS